MAASKEAPQSLAENDQPLPQTVDATAETATTEEQKTIDDTTTEMPPGGKPRSNTLRREADLSSLLSPVEKTELTALVTRVTDSMLRHVTQLFDPVRAEDKTGTPRIAFWSKLPSYLKDLSLGDAMNGAQIRGPVQKENVKPPPRSKKAGRARDKRDAIPSAANGTSQQESDVTPRLQELKKEALQHFRKWQTTVHRRIGEISVKRGPDALLGPASPGPRGRPSSGRRGKPGGRTQPGSFTPQAADSMSGPKAPIAPTTSAITLEVDPVLMQLYPPTATPLCQSPAEKRCLILHALFLLLLSIENYGGYTRVLLLNIASSLQLPLRILAEDEARVGGALAQITKDIPPELLTQKKEDGKPSRRWKAGQAGTGGAVGAGIPSSVVAALQAARIGSVFGITGIPGAAAAGLLGILTENPLAVGSMFGIYGARNSGKMMEHYLKDVGDFAFIPLRGSLDSHSEISKIAPESRRLRVVLGISGWLTNRDDHGGNWQCLGDEGEVYAVQWELDALSKLGNSFDTLVRSAAWSMAKKEITARTSEPRSRSLKHSALNANQHGPVFSNLADGRWPASLLKISKIIDNTWNNGMVRADKLGAVLADVIMSKAQGERGVSLIGYSLGARAIYACLMSLAEKRAFGLVENAVLMGTPAPSQAMAWCAMKSVVSGRLVNVYSENDYILGFLYRTSSIEFGLAGLQRVTGVDGIESVDVTAKVSVHLRYQYLVGSILQHIGWEDINKEQIARDEAEMSFYEDRNRKHEERRDAVELGKVLEVKNENEQGVVRTRMRKKGRK
ncbi:hypothetical protein NEMBOFW57_004336 [Staphylotrichum longicolle]|uniref:DUF726-domain-containing protein n=1 Tax=Staphylotrichum longicolle TaxID=669026 RepID=A0AAD4F6L9_9PEZI|nr:hypothetical protein NEMBOFW57_004336 [Staphylotrichum longicolle]